MNPNDDTYIPKAAPTLQGYQYGVIRLPCPILEAFGDSIIFARAFNTRWGYHNVNTRLVEKLRVKMRVIYGLRQLPTLAQLNSRGWLISNPYRNLTRLTCFARVLALKQEPFYFDGFMD